MHEIQLSRDEDLFAYLRAMVEQGAPDGPAKVYREGVHSVSIRSIHRAACLVAGKTDFSIWVPYKTDKVGPIMTRLLAAMRDEIDQRVAARAEARAKREAKP